MSYLTIPIDRISHRTYEGPDGKAAATVSISGLSWSQPIHVHSIADEGFDYLIHHCWPSIDTNGECLVGTCDDPWTPTEFGSMLGCAWFVPKATADAL